MYLQKYEKNDWMICLQIPQLCYSFRSGSFIDEDRIIEKIYVFCFIDNQISSLSNDITSCNYC